MTSHVLIAAIYYLCSIMLGETFSAHDAALLLSTFFIFTTIRSLIPPFRIAQNNLAGRFVRETALSWGLTVLMLLVLGWVSGMGDLYDRRVIVAWIAAVPICLLVHQVITRLAPADSHQTSTTRSAIVIGANDAGARLAETCTRNPHLSVHVRGYFDDRSELNIPRNTRYPVLGRMADVAPYVREHRIKMIFISQPISAHPRIRQLIDELHDTTASVYFLPDLYTFNLMQGRVDDVGGMPVIAICETPLTGINNIVKRGSDIFFAMLILLIFLPVMLGIALAIKLDSPGPAIFRQRRYGLYGDEIIVYKFRSMRVSEDGATIVQASKNDPRVTRLGAFLRRSSLDELPQLINVLQGRMSIVGPRPHAVAHNETYRKLIKGYMLRHKVRPGITGWAQVNGLRGETATLDRMQARIDYDLNYLREWSIWRDLWIMLLTIRTVLGRDNAH